MRGIGKTPLPRSLLFFLFRFTVRAVDSYNKSTNICLHSRAKQQHIHSLQRCSKVLKNLNILVCCSDTQTVKQETKIQNEIQLTLKIYDREKERERHGE